jgi:hypothetical protein
MKNVIITAVVVGALLFGTGALLFALAAGTIPTDQQHHYGAHNSTRHHASLPPVW